MLVCNVISMAGLKSAFLLFMIIIMRIFVVFVDDTSSSLQTFKEILAFSGRCFRSILLEPSQGIFFKMIFLSFFFWASNNHNNLLRLLSLILKGDEDWAEKKMYSINGLGRMQKDK